MNYFKTFVLLALMGAVLVVIGGILGGTKGLVIALALALIFQFFSYWFSDKLVLAMYGAKPVTAAESPELYSMVRNLSTRMDLPMPKLYIINMGAPNAFATGRNKEHAAVAVSPSIMEALSKHELEAVLAHELTHIKNRDILVATIAATLATAITFIARMAHFAALFGGLGGRDRDDGDNILGLLVMAIVAPLAALLIQMGISRSREYLADEGSARVTNRPASLISALEKIHNYAKEYPLIGGSPSTSHLFIANPFPEGFFVNIFSTHPTFGRRKKNLEKVAIELGQSVE